MAVNLCDLLSYQTTVQKILGWYSSPWQITMEVWIKTFPNVKDQDVKEVEDQYSW